jgi:AraC-like DNA-binding protein
MLLCALSLLLGLYVLSTRRSAALAMFFFVTALHTVLRIIDNTIFDSAFSGLTFPLSYLYGALIFLAIRDLLFRTPSPWWPHLLPAAIALALKLYGINNPLFFGISIAVVHIAYLWATFKLVFYYSRVSNTVRSGGPEGVTWLLRCLGVYALIISYQMLRYVIDPLVLEENAPIHLLFHATTSVIFAGIILQIMRYPGLLKALAPEDVELEQTISQPLSVAGAISETAAENPLPDTGNDANIAEYRHIMQRVDALMSEQKPFREPELSLNDMAERLDIPARLVSQAINSIHNSNFPEYINRARVDEAKRLMANNEWSRRSLLDIGLEAGFNSKSSFNLMFKRIAEITPSAYRRMLRDGEQPS